MLLDSSIYLGDVAYALYCRHPVQPRGPGRMGAVKGTSGDQSRLTGYPIMAHSRAGIKVAGMKQNFDVRVQDINGRLQCNPDGFTPDFLPTAMLQMTYRACIIMRTLAYARHPCACTHAQGSPHLICCEFHERLLLWIICNNHPLIPFWCLTGTHLERRWPWPWLSPKKTAVSQDKYRTVSTMTSACNLAYATLQLCPHYFRSCGTEPVLLLMNEGGTRHFRKIPQEIEGRSTSAASLADKIHTDSLHDDLVPPQRLASVR
jgi:hypothetical protein